MALKYIVDSLDGVDASLHEHYERQGDKYRLKVEGARSQQDVDNVQRALNAEREVSKGYKTRLDAWGDRKPEEVLPILDRVPELEAAAADGKKKLDQTQIDAIVNGRLAPVQRSLEEVTRNYKAAQEQIGTYEAQNRRRTIFDAVRGIASETKALPETYSSDYGSFMLLAERIFTVNDQGQVVVREGVPDLVHGQAPKDIVGELQRLHPYLWPPSSGGGASGNTGNTGGGANVFKQNNMTERSKFIKANENRPDVVNAAMKAAGLTSHYQQYTVK